jgi:hypothetical protein
MFTAFTVDAVKVLWTVALFVTNVLPCIVEYVTDTAFKLDPWSVEFQTPVFIVIVEPWRLE